MPASNPEMRAFNELLATANALRLATIRMENVLDILPEYGHLKCKCDASTMESVISHLLKFTDDLETEAEAVALRHAELTSIDDAADPCGDVGGVEVTIGCDACS